MSDGFLNRILCYTTTKDYFIIRILFNNYTTTQMYSLKDFEISESFMSHWAYTQDDIILANTWLRHWLDNRDNYEPDCNSCKHRFMCFTTERRD